MSLVYTSQVSSFQSLEPFLKIHSVPARLSLAFDPSQILLDFLRGSGTPCPSLFRDVEAIFSPAIDLTRMNDPGFRSRIFCWALSGTPSAPINGALLDVSIGSNDIAFSAHFAWI